MTPEAKAFIETTEKMAKIFIAKNHDYGNSYAETVRELGPVAGFATIINKFNRLKNIIKGVNPLVEGETIEDTLLDMANYCIMLNMELKKLQVMKRNTLIIWFCALTFGVIQMTADVIKGILTHDYFLVVCESAALVWMVYLGVRVYRPYKDK